MVLFFSTFHIRIVEVSGSNPLCSTTRKTLDSIRILGSFFIFLYNRFPGVDSRFDSNQLLSRVLMGQKRIAFFVSENPPKKAKKSKKLEIAEKILQKSLRIPSGKVPFSPDYRKEAISSMPCRLVVLSLWTYFCIVKATLECPITSDSVRISWPLCTQSVANVWRRA